MSYNRYLATLLVFTASISLSDITFPTQQTIRDIVVNESGRKVKTWKATENNPAKRIKIRGSVDEFDWLVWRFSLDHINFKLKTLQ